MSDTSAETLTRVRLKEPSMWTIIIHNDDFTPFPFVEMILNAYFNKTTEEAEAIAQTVHESGKAKLGLFTKEIAQSKVATVMKVCAQHNHPLTLTAEEA
jgi:ATP-dependent Clp protease adaptor protein ClpS